SESEPGCGANDNQEPDRRNQGGCQRPASTQGYGCAIEQGIKCNGQNHAPEDDRRKRTNQYCCPIKNEPKRCEPNGYLDRSRIDLLPTERGSRWVHGLHEGYFIEHIPEALASARVREAPTSPHTVESRQRQASGNHLTTALENKRQGAHARSPCALGQHCGRPAAPVKSR